jgi:hypothetical protein
MISEQCRAGSGANIANCRVGIVRFGKWEPNLIKLLSEYCLVQLFNYAQDCCLELFEPTLMLSPFILPPSFWTFSNRALQTCASITATAANCIHSQLI